MEMNHPMNLVIKDMSYRMWKEGNKISSEWTLRIKTIIINIQIISKWIFQYYNNNIRAWYSLTSIQFLFIRNYYYFINMLLVFIQKWQIENDFAYVDLIRQITFQQCAYCRTISLLLSFIIRNTFEYTNAKKFGNFANTLRRIFI